MGLPVKLSDDLVLAARAEAQAASRSITSQIEHWARLGQAAEAMLRHSDVLTLKSQLDQLREETARQRPSKAARVRAVLEHVAHSQDRRTVLAELVAPGKPLFEADPQHPGLVLRVEPDGSLSLGRFEGGVFLPAAETAGKRC